MLKFCQNFIKNYIHNLKIYLQLYSEFKNYIQNPKYHYIQNFQNRSILSITKQGYNHLFYWNLTPLSPSNEIGAAA
jgi:hypothetical protein